MKFRQRLQLMRDDRGQVALLIGLLMLPLMGSLGLVLDGGLLFFNHRLTRPPSQVTVEMTPLSGDFQGQSGK